MCSDTPKDREVDALSRRNAWARLLAKVHELDVMACPRCGSRMWVIAAIRPSGVRREEGSVSPPSAGYVVTDPAQIRKIIACLDRHGRGPPPMQ
jgi:DNA-directed RNA polymerase subunit RPC12/RpoP